MKTELDRSMKTLGAQDPPAYYIGYTVTDSQRATVSGSNGALLSSDEARNRWLEVTVRTGSYELDDTHKVDGQRRLTVALAPTPRWTTIPKCCAAPSGWKPTSNTAPPPKRSIKIKTGKEVKVQTEEGSAPDFSREKPQDLHRALGFHSRSTASPGNRKFATIRDTSGSPPRSSIPSSRSPRRPRTSIQLNSEGTHLQFGQIRYRLELFIQGKAGDGMDIDRYYNFDWVNPAEAPSDKAVLRRRRSASQGDGRPGRLAPERSHVSAPRC